MSTSAPICPKCLYAPPEHVGPGVPVHGGFMLHSPDCPDVAFMQQVAEDLGAAHVGTGGGFMLSPGEQEARRVAVSVGLLRQRVEKLEGQVDVLIDMVRGILKIESQ